MSHQVRDVGIVMPIYKQRKQYLTQAIGSIRRQRYRWFRMVIVLDGAPPDTVRQVRQLIDGDKRIHVIEWTSNRGVAAALNRGFQSLYRHDEIRYLTWVSSDNIYNPEYIHLLRRKLRRSSARVGLAYSAFTHIDAVGQPALSEEARTVFLEWQRQSKVDLLDICFIGASFMYKRRYAERTGAYGMEPVEDYDYWLRMTRHCDIAYLPMDLMSYRMNSQYSISRKLASSTKAHRAWRDAFQRIKRQARLCRGMDVSLTIVVPLMTTRHSCMRAIETLLEQFYSHYDIVLVDGTEGIEVQAMLDAIPDPRITVVKAVGSLEECVEAGKAVAKTPHVVALSCEQLPNIDLDAILQSLHVS